MLNIIKIAGRNLRRYQRRTILTSALITLGVAAVLLFISTTGSFKDMMVGQITDSMLGHIQIHRTGYLASIDSLPLDRNMNQRQVAKVKNVLSVVDAVESYSMRIKLGAMFSNFTQTTNIRLNTVIPEQEVKTVPLLSDRIIQGDK
ncbi:MAG: ABC transporter permease, partial [Desulfobacterales bacterium]